MARAATLPTPLPFDIRATMAGANALLVLLALVLLGSVAWWLAHSPLFTLRGIVLEGDLAHNTPRTVRAAVGTRLDGNFLSVDLEQARDVFEEVPWVRRATVRRVWPDRLAVRLEEHRVAALWNAGSDDERLVNTFGEVFEANLGDVDDEALPRLAGPEGSAERVLEMLQQLEPVLQPLGSPVRLLQLTRHGAWRTRLANGVTIELGRGEPADLVARAARFVRTLPQVTGPLQRPLLSADLRHADGYAVRLKGVTTGNAAARH